MTHGLETIVRRNELVDRNAGIANRIMVAQIMKVIIEHTEEYGEGKRVFTIDMNTLAERLRETV